MLKALELAGFKSFADRTRFDFPDGITVIVGPNGSGKSNIVDAIKWVLGSQSAKSLRGKDMSDVIFKGSQTRPAAGAAEATIVFDNSGGNLPVDSEEVHVTRRVYRSGESEYLINGQAVRLKDVRDLIRGTGIGIDAYSLIEQGKVDRMLQANAKDRRAIFEEAAGISRFKAKKLEAERRLARVQSNLTRLGDIVEEVGARLKSVRSQASKAERYRQASERLRELRTVIAWTDWTSLNSEVESCERELSEAVQQQEKLQRERDELNQQRQSADLQLQEIADKARELESSRSAALQRIAALTGRRDADRASVQELRSSVAKSLLRVRQMQAQTGTAAAELRGAHQQQIQYQQDLDTVKEKNIQLEQDRNRIQAEAAEVIGRRDEVQRDHLKTVRLVASLETDRQRIDSQLGESDRLLKTLASRRDTASNELEQARVEAESRAQAVRDLETEIERVAAEISVSDSKVQENRQTLDRRSQETAALRTRLEGVRGRYLVLEDLQRRHEGVAGGVREVLEQLRDDDRGEAVGSVADTVDGMVADLVNANVETAPLIDAALGHRSQYLVATGSSLSDAIDNGTIGLDGRVGIIRVDQLPEPPTENRIQLEGLQGVIGRADKVIECDPSQSKLISHLLSSTWLVEDLAAAKKIKKLGGANQRFVTKNGEVLESDGTMILGPESTAGGLISRRSELNAAAEEIEHYTFQISENDATIGNLAKLVDELQSELGRIQLQQRELITRKAAAEAEQRHAAERLTELDESYVELTAEINSARRTRDEAKLDAERVDSQIIQGKQQVESLEASSAEIDETLSETQQALQNAADAVMSISVEVARAEQKHEALSAKIAQMQRDQAERESVLQDARLTADQGRSRVSELNERMLSATNELSTLHWESEQIDGSLKTLAEKADEIREANRETMQASEAAIKSAAKASEAVHSITNRRDSAKHRLETLAERIQEDYQIDLEHDEPPEELSEIEDRQAMEDEISRLRDQLQRTSNVNMEALAELEGLQERYDHLNGQYQDLSAAKDSLQRIIGRINADSRRLFLDTLEAIRQNFQKLYRKSFGGGHADLVLEDADDPLEAGVEIVATPPGKPSFSNSLLSGGEKALTAVALLMSIFQYRPSPFCVLDEVDAPFDEANIGRFVTVLNEFLDHSKFVIVTHSKKTMTAATTLYGVTMQESGVSKRVSIRFEDVSDDGEISEGEAA